MRLSDSKLFRYFIFGSLAASSQLAMLTAFVELAAMPKIVASTAAFYLAVLINYYLQKQHTFRSAEPDWAAMPKFLAVSTLGAGINIAIFAVLSEVTHYFIAQCVALLIVFMFNYGVSRMFVFRARQPDYAPGEQ